MPRLPIVFALLLAPTVWAQPAPDAAPLDAATRALVVARTAEFVEANYVLPDAAHTLAEAVRRRAREGAYEALPSASVLAEALTADLRAAHPDRHLAVVFSAEPTAMQSEAGALPEAEAIRQRTNARRQNHFVERAEHLDGNVGYLKLRRFADPALGAEAIAAAMAFLADTDALLVDLRQNGGGHGEMVAFLASYFFEEPVHLSDYHDRPSGEVKPSWTLPYVPGRRYLDRPVFLLTSTHTFSAAEGFAYAMQTLGRATVVGETTRGGAHPVGFYQINEHVHVRLPVGRVVSPLTGTDWEGTGIVPDVASPADDAPRTAHRLALEALRPTTGDAEWAAFLGELAGELSAPAPTPVPAADVDPARYVGAYRSPMGPLVVTSDAGRLWARRGDEAPLALTPRGPDTFEATDVGATLTFVGDAGQPATRIQIAMGGQQLEVERIE